MEVAQVQSLEGGQVHSSLLLLLVLSLLILGFFRSTCNLQQHILEIALIFTR